MKQVKSRINRFGQRTRWTPLLVGWLLAVAACDPGQGAGPDQGGALARVRKNLVVVGARAVSGLSVAPTSVPAGSTAIGTVTMVGSAGTTSVTLTVDPPGAATVSELIQIPDGLDSGSFTIATAALPATTTVRITASAGGASVFVDLIVLASSEPPPSPTAIIDDPGCRANTLPANDDGSTAAVNLPFAVNFFGATYGFFYINNNGNVTFNLPMSTFTPFTITASTPPIIAPFFADVDTRGSGSSPVTYSFGAIQFQGRPAMCVNWVNVGYYSGHVDKLNSFQLLLVDRGDDRGVAGDFDIVMNYDRIAWETGDASGGANGFGGTPAGAGFSAGTGRATEFYQFPGSLSAGGLLDSNGATGLTRTSRGGATPGRHRFEVRGQSVGNGVVRGTVTGPTGQPIGGAPLQICPVAGGRCVFTTLTGVPGGQFIASGLAEGDYNLTVFPSAGSTSLSRTVGPIHVAAGTTQQQDVVLTGPTPPPAGVSISPSNSGGGGIPTVYWQTPLQLRAPACSGGTASYLITAQGGQSLASGPMSEGPAGIFSATVPPFFPNHGTARVHIQTLCPGGTTETIDFDIYIDPSGVVRTLDGAPIPGALVTLFRADSASGPFAVVPDGSAVMSPMNRHNPAFTDDIGHFGWDVVSGFYKVRAQATGCTSAAGAPFVESEVLPIPPPITNLDLRLLCPDVIPPVTSATIAGAANPAGWYQAPPVVSLLAVDEVGGSGVASLRYTLAGADTADATVVGAAAQVMLQTDGSSTLSFSASDHAGNLEAPHQLAFNLDRTPPLVTCGATPSVISSPTGGLVPVQVEVAASDATSGLASVTLAAIDSDVAVGSGDQQGFVVGQASPSGQLRAGPGARTYRLTYAAVDVAGNRATCVATVRVAVVAVDAAAPRCAVTRVGAAPGGARGLQFTVADDGSGLSAVRVVSATGGVVSVPAFAPGTTAAVTVSAVLAARSTAESIILDVADVAGNRTQCAAAWLRVSGAAPKASVTGLADTLKTLTLYNGTPGARAGELKVNTTTRLYDKLKDGLVRSLDLTGALKPGNVNKVAVTLDCPITGSAELLIWSGVGATPPRS